jgi:hypothetical protein
VLTAKLKAAQQALLDANTKQEDYKALLEQVRCPVVC